MDQVQQMEPVVLSEVVKQAITSNMQGFLQMAMTMEAFFAYSGNLRMAYGELNTLEQRTTVTSIH